MMKLGQVAQQSIEEVLELIRKGNIPSIEHVLWNGMPAREVRIKDNAFYLSEKEYSMLIDEMVSQSLVEDEIPKNSETLLISEETSRFNSAIWFDKTRKLMQPKSLSHSSVFLPPENAPLPPVRRTPLLSAPQLPHNIHPPRIPGSVPCWLPQVSLRSPDGIPLCNHC